MSDFAPLQSLALGVILHVFFDASHTRSSALE